MRGKRPSEEELRQREKEERSRQKLQEEAYREAQRGVYSRIYQEQNALPDDYREALRPIHRDRPPKQTEQDWEAETLVNRGPGYRHSRTAEPTDFWTEPPEPDKPPVWERDEEWVPLWENDPEQDEWTAPSRRNRSAHANSAPPEDDLYEPPDSPPPRSSRDRPTRRKKKRSRAPAVVFLVLAAIILLGLAAHTMLVRKPDLPTESSQEGIPPNILEAGRKEDVYTFLLVGRDDAGGGNTDTIMVGCYDVKNGTLDVLSIFRDTLVDVPWEIKKINSVYNREGIEGLREQIKNLTGYAPDYYFVVEMDAVSELVDAIGGVTYEVPFNMDYDDPVQDLHIHFKQGKQKLNGEDSVKLLRWRKNNSGEALSVGDVGRVELQHTFLKSMAKQMVSLGNLPRMQRIVQVLDENLTSNLDYGEMIWFGEQALKMKQDGISFHTLPGDYNGSLWSSTYQNYQSYVFVNDKMLLDLVNQHMNPYLADITPDMQHIIYGTTVSSPPILPGKEEAASEPQN